MGPSESLPQFLILIYERQPPESARAAPPTVLEAHLHLPRQIAETGARIIAGNALGPASHAVSIRDNVPVGGSLASGSPVGDAAVGDAPLGGSVASGSPVGDAAVGDAPGGDAAVGDAPLGGSVAGSGPTLAGYFLVEASDLDHAVWVGRMVPVIDGWVEVRPVLTS
ncbi:hypothetical protein BJY16_008860 [Actinoplanes octamycinicus]|uniref:YCII-related domain-containing protein n=1 Tax=Actinoplanes octamycinicus TaxID=135948 RepID=A0A7W7H7E0_9ACTN|nr:hypothetical protein [Actinoplanes octamycinicus]MBB4745401.1 hypothetical protein [Actinoplanes octamycinicus]